MQDDVEQASAAERRRLRHAGHRRGVECRAAARRVADDPQPHAALRDERVPIGQHRQAERMHQALGDDDDPNLVLFSRVEGVGLGGEDHRGDPDILGLILLRHGGDRHDGNGNRQLDPTHDPAR